MGVNIMVVEVKRGGIVKTFPALCRPDLLACDSPAGRSCRSALCGKPRRPTPVITKLRWHFEVVKVDSTWYKAGICATEWIV